MDKTQTVLQTFWQRVLDRPDARAILIKNPSTEPIIIAIPSTIRPSATVIPAPAYVYLSHAQLGTAVAAVAAFLRNSGFRHGDRAAIMAWNCPEWVIADLAIQSVGGITVPIYPHSTPEQVNFVLKDSGARFLFSNETAQLDKADTSTGCRTVLFDDIASLPGVAAGSDTPFLHRLFYNEQAIVALAAREFKAIASDPSCGVTGGDIATIIYTSGSTGVPKGVVLTHRAFASACEGMLAHGFNINPDNDVYLSYLPLAHVYERACGTMLCLWTGVPMAFCGIDELASTLKVVRPTLLHGVPAVWRKIKEKIDGNIAHATGIKGRLIAWAFAQKQPGLKRWFADKLVFAKIRRELGGRLRLCTSGGAPISPEIIEFYREIGIELLQGYGLTETTGASVVNRPSGCVNGACNKVGSVGTLIREGGLEMRIAPLAGQEDSGEGEIQFRGPTVMTGYWNRPEDTAKTFTQDGWFKTGDRGRVDADGFVFITGRIKRLLKTDGGKYVAPEKIEKAFEDSPIVAYVVPVGDGKPFISALVFVNQQLALELVSKTGTGLATVPMTPAVLASQQVVIDAVAAAVERANSKLERWETLKKFSIIPVEATVADGLLTPTLKIRTEEVLQRYGDVVEDLYRKPRSYSGIHRGA